MIRHNYHTHTFRCGHAVGEDEEYVLEAIGMGMQTLGFSDHIMLENFSQPSVRGEFELSENYFLSINALKEKYKERINILLGYEAEPFFKYYPYYRDLLINNKVDYLILGNHFALENDKISYFFSKSTSKDDLIRYKDTLIAGLKTGLFLYVAHPDYFMGGYPFFDRTCKMISEEICECAKELDIPLEFNFAAIRRGKVSLGGKQRYLYPHEGFWKIARKKGCKVIIGIDAHGPKELSHIRNDLGIKMVKDLGLEVINSLDVKNYYQNNLKKIEQLNELKEKTKKISLNRH